VVRTGADVPGRLVRGNAIGPRADNCLRASTCLAYPGRCGTAGLSGRGECGRRSATAGQAGRATPAIGTMAHSLNTYPGEAATFRKTAQILCEFWMGSGVPLVSVWDSEPATLAHITLSLKDL
jgi:hypothetical protein